MAEGRAKRTAIGIGVVLMLLAIVIWQSIHIASCVRNTRGPYRGASRYRWANFIDAAAEAMPPDAPAHR